MIVQKRFQRCSYGGAGKFIAQTTYCVDLPFSPQAFQSLHDLCFQNEPQWIYETSFKVTAQVSDLNPVLGEDWSAYRNANSNTIRRVLGGVHVSTGRSVVLRKARWQ